KQRRNYLVTKQYEPAYHRMLEKLPASTDYLFDPEAAKTVVSDLQSSSLLQSFRKKPNPTGSAHSSFKGVSTNRPAAHQKLQRWSASRGSNRGRGSSSRFGNKGRGKHPDDTGSKGSKARGPP